MFKKKFSEAHNREFDSPAREATKRYFENSPNLRVVDRTLDGGKGIDLCLYDGETFLRHLEAETKDDSKWKRPWTRTEFPWPDVNFLYRKLEHLKKRAGGYDPRGLWVLWNKSYTEHLVVQFSDIERLYTKAVEIEKAGGSPALTHVPNWVEREAQKHLPEEQRQKDMFLKIPKTHIHLNGLDEVLRKYSHGF